jgi:bifunctional non-homologous end joining protein LigD
VSWEEVEICLKKKDPKLLVFESSQVLERVAQAGDLFAPVQTLKQRLPNVSQLSGEPNPKSASKGRTSAASKAAGSKKRVAIKPRSQAKRAG